MKFNPRAKLDTSGTSDRRGRGGFGGGLGGGKMGGIPGGGIAVGGGGLGLVVVLIIVLLSQFAGGGGGGGQALAPGTEGTVDQGTVDLREECQTAQDITETPECRFVAYATSVEDYWPKVVRGYEPAGDVYFAGQVSTGCGAASSQVGPFYCPADSTVYLDLNFFDTLQQQFGAQGGDFAEAYVVAHEYGHHVQNVLGTMGRVQQGSGAESDAVRLELQADCFAGVWAKNATTTTDEEGETLITEISREDIAEGLDAAEKVGDDYIQSTVGGGQVNPESWTHGSSEQRQRWFTTGFESGDARQCDTFSAQQL